MTFNWRNRTLWTGDNLDVMRGMNSRRAFVSNHVLVESTTSFPPLSCLARQRP